MPATFFHLLFFVCCAVAWHGKALSNPAQTWPSADLLPLTTTLKTNGAPDRADDAERQLAGVLRQNQARNSHTATRQSAAQTSEQPQLVSSVRLMDASDQGFQAVAVNLPVNLVIGQTQVNLGLGWIGPQNGKPTGDITQGSAPQFAEKHFRDSAENSVVFLFRIPF